ncbi:antiterminator Q family protein [Xenorhabdus taiwanensis]|uniref:Antiterminator Q family protein n=1 Tax=Xenorhabdus taiwanensis TaxID=3085177 RepID=A0ABM8JZJ2_9GAMM|nr:antiterminator Q family protein [Xenorhabdus sp. TCT-1]
MRDIQMVLERWGAWAADNSDGVHWSSIAAGFKGLIPNKVKSRPQCCDDDAIIISGCMARLNKNNSEAHDLLFDYYVFGKTFMQLAYDYHCSDTHIGKRLQKAEGVIEGMLMMLDISLEMDKYVQKEPLDINQHQLCSNF